MPSDAKYIHEMAVQMSFSRLPVGWKCNRTLNIYISWQCKYHFPNPENSDFENPRRDPPKPAQKRRFRTIFVSLWTLGHLIGNSGTARGSDHSANLTFPSACQVKMQSDAKYIHELAVQMSLFPLPVRLKCNWTQNLYMSWQPKCNLSLCLSG